mgnify:CR=1 FL=1
MLETMYPLGAGLAIVLTLALAGVVVWRLGPGWRLVAQGAAYGLAAGAATLILGIVIGLASSAWLLSRPDFMTAQIAVGLASALVLVPISEGLRYFWLRQVTPDVRSWRKAVLFGAGAAVFSGLGSGLGQLLAYGGMTMQRSFTLSEAQLAELPPEQVAQIRAGLAQVANYWAVADYVPLLQGLDVVMLAVAQVTLTVLVLQAFAQRSWLWVGLAMGFSLLTTTLYTIGTVDWPPELLSGLLLVWTAIGVTLVVWLRGYDAPEAEQPEARVVT